jgi:hypothetical protein
LKGEKRISVTERGANARGCREEYADYDDDDVDVCLGTFGPIGRDGMYRKRNARHDMEECAVLVIADRCSINVL